MKSGIHMFEKPRPSLLQLFRPRPSLSPSNSSFGLFAVSHPSAPCLTEPPTSVGFMTQQVTACFSCLCPTKTVSRSALSLHLYVWKFKPDGAEGLATAEEASGAEIRPKRSSRQAESSLKLCATPLLYSFIPTLPRFKDGGQVLHLSHLILDSRSHNCPENTAEWVSDLRQRVPALCCSGPKKNGTRNDKTRINTGSAFHHLNSGGRSWTQKFPHGQIEARKKPASDVVLLFTLIGLNPPQAPPTEEHQRIKRRRESVPRDVTGHSGPMVASFYGFGFAKGCLGDVELTHWHNPTPRT
ncbi:hypothetical protein AOLI_G00042800 [Acnodon oligacanthus]